MKKEDISEALNDVDFNTVENACEHTEEKKSKPWLKWSALVASLLLIIGAAIALPMLLQDNLPDVPLWDASHFPAEDVISPIDSTLVGVAANTFTIADNNSLPLNPISWDCYMRIFEQTNVKAEPNKAELQTIADAAIPKLADALGVPRPEYSVENPFSDQFRVKADAAPYKIEISQYSQETSLKIFNASDSDQPMVLDGIPVQADLSLSSEEILESLQPIKERLFKLFGVSFSEVDILRGSSSCSIVFYNKTGHYLEKLNGYHWMADYIHIQFHRNDTDDNLLTNVTIDYRKPRVDVDERYPLVAKAKRLSLKDAGKLLKKGYVFTREGFCGLFEGSISFDSYDYVSLEYIFRRMKDGSTLGIPFYAFYKELSTAPDGGTVYAETYVPAIEADGYEEFFEELRKYD